MQPIKPGVNRSDVPLVQSTPSSATEAQVQKLKNLQHALFEPIRETEEYKKVLEFLSLSLHRTCMMFVARELIFRSYSTKMNFNGPTQGPSAIEPELSRMEQANYEALVKDVAAIQATKTNKALESDLIINRTAYMKFCYDKFGADAVRRISVVFFRSFFPNETSQEFTVLIETASKQFTEACQKASQNSP